MIVHRTTVDAYAAQHPGVQESRTVQSVNVHLIGLHLVLERGAQSDFARRAIAALTREKDSLAWLDPPSSLGEITVANVTLAETAEEHGRLVREWGRSVWQAWTPHHLSVRRLAEQAVRMLS